MSTEHKVYFAPMMANELGLGFTDKRNRNPNWTDHEIIRYLEILSEDQVIKDLAANRNKQVFCYVSQKMGAEGFEKSWDQCRIKIKNLKSQYRYVKDRIPNIDEVDIEDEEILVQLIAECQGRGISPSHIKHLKYLMRFMKKSNDANVSQLKTALEVRSEILGPSADPPGMFSGPGFSQAGPSRPFRVEKGFGTNDTDPYDDMHSPTRSPERNAEPDSTEPVAKKAKKESLDDYSKLLDGTMLDGYKYIEKFNRDMMDQFMEFQKRYTSSYVKWEQERFRQEQLALEQWRDEAREHEKQMFGVFCKAISHCNTALNTLLRAKQDATDEMKRLRAEHGGAVTTEIIYTEEDDTNDD